MEKVGPKGFGSNLRWIRLQRHGNFDWDTIFSSIPLVPKAENSWYYSKTTSVFKERFCSVAPLTLALSSIYWLSNWKVSKLATTSKWMWHRSHLRQKYSRWTFPPPLCPANRRLDSSFVSVSKATKRWKAWTMKSSLKWGFLLLRHFTHLIWFWRVVMNHLSPITIILPLHNLIPVAK